MAVAPIEVEATLSYIDAKVWHGLVNSTTGLLTGKGLAVAIGFMFVFTALNLFGIKWMARTNSVAMVWKILVPFMTVIFLMAKAFHTSNFTAVGGFMPFGIKGVFIAIPLGIVFALEGFEQAAQLAGEARNPRRDVPIAVVASMLLGAALYILLQLCFTGALNPATGAKLYMNDDAAVMAPTSVDQLPNGRNRMQPKAPPKMMLNQGTPRRSMLANTGGTNRVLPSEYDSREAALT
jgi:amino acid transporter